MPDPRPVPDAETLARWAESDRQAEAEFEGRREAWGPEWPAWLSMTDIEPEPEAFSTPDSHPDRLEARHEDDLAKTEATAGEAETGLSPEAQDELSEAELNAIEAEAEQRFADYWGGTGPDYEAAENEATCWAEDDAAWRQRPAGEAEAQAEAEPWW